MIWRFFTSRECLVSYLICAIASLVYVWVVGPDGVRQDLEDIGNWLLGGDYQGYAVLSVAFAMNTWGLAVRSTRRKVRIACQRKLRVVISGLSTSGYMYALDARVATGGLGFFTGLWLKWLEKSISRYEHMIPQMLEVSSRLTELSMGASAFVSVVSMIFGINGRFAAILLLPYPVFWLYCKVATMWVKFMLETPVILLRLAGISQAHTFDTNSFVKTVEYVSRKISSEIEERG